MAKQLFANNASSLLAASINDTDLAIQVGVGDGALYPNPGANEFFLVTLVNADGDYEIVKVSSRTSDILTVPAAGRGQEGTAAAAWTNGLTRVELRNTKGTLDRFLQREGDVMSGDLDMDGNDIVDSSLTGDWKGTNGQLVGTALRGTEDDASNEVVVPPGGGPATSGGEIIHTSATVEQVRTTAWEVGMIIDWYGAAVNCPDGFAICDGTNGTPDMRDRVSVGASGTKALDSTGGEETASGNTGAAGGHSHGGAVGGTAISTAQMPAHGHAIRGDSSGDTDSTTPGFGNGGGIGIGGKYMVTPADITNVSGGSDALIRNTGGGETHTHTIPAEGTHTHALGSISVMQPYRALHKIMFIGYP